MVATKTRMVGKRAIRILLECFLVGNRLEFFGRKKKVTVQNKLNFNGHE